MSKRGINSQGLGAEFAAAEARKSQLLLAAQLLRAQQQDAAATQFAEAALIEEQLSEICETNGLLEKALLHRFSAVGCWAQAGNFYRAIALCDEIQNRQAVPERLSQPIREYAATLRARRVQWYEELAAA